MMETRTRGVELFGVLTSQVEFYRDGRRVGTLIRNPRDSCFYLWRGESDALLARYADRPTAMSRAPELLEGDGTEFVEDLVEGAR